MGTIGNHRGTALVLTLGIVAVLVAATLEISRQTRSGLLTTAAVRDRLTLAQAATGAVHVAMAVLVRDKTISTVDSVQEDWADARQMSRLYRTISGGDPAVDLAVADELGKIQVNALVRFPDTHQPNTVQMLMLEQVLAGRADDRSPSDPFDARAAVNAIKDWIDSGDDDAVTGLTGAESDTYRQMDPPRFCRNAPMPHISDLAWVRGISRQILAGDENRPGMAAMTTVHGVTADAGGRMVFPGKININTADLAVLAALMPPGAEDLARAVVDYRAEKSGSQYVNDIQRAKWYTDVPGFSLLTGEKRSFFQSVITTSSDLFSITAKAERGGIACTVRAVVRREKMAETGKWTCRVLSWEESN